MKIEKVNENQIRCTLTKQDLADRQINLRELAYGSEKAKGLFHDMIQQANYEFGFDVSDNPLMVEAIPLSSESLVWRKISESNRCYHYFCYSNLYYGSYQHRRSFIIRRYQHYH